jgi:hypothetical protein
LYLEHCRWDGDASNRLILRMLFEEGGRILKEFGRERGLLRYPMLSLEEGVGLIWGYCRYIVPSLCQVVVLRGQGYFDFLSRFERGFRVLQFASSPIQITK